MSLLRVTYRVDAIAGKHAKLLGFRNVADIDDHTESRALEVLSAMKVLHPSTRFRLVRTIEEVIA